MTTNGAENDPEQDSPPSGGGGSATGNGKDADDDLLPVPSDFLSNLPPELQASLPEEIRAQLANRAGGSVLQAFSASMSMTLGSIVNPIASRVTSQHITDLIGITSREADYADRQSEREYSDRKHTRNWAGALIGMIILAVTAVVVILVFQGILDFLRDMAMLIIPAIGGVGIGVVIGFRIGIRYANARPRQ